LLVRLSIPLKRHELLRGVLLTLLSLPAPLLLLLLLVALPLKLMHVVVLLSSLHRKFSCCAVKPECAVPRPPGIVQLSSPGPRKRGLWVDAPVPPWEWRKR
jgi:hypothetical protein